MPVVRNTSTGSPASRATTAFCSSPLRWALVLSALLLVQALSLRLNAAFAQPVQAGQGLLPSYTLALSPERASAAKPDTAQEPFFALSEDALQAQHVLADDTANDTALDAAPDTSAQQAQLHASPQEQTASHYGNSRIDNLRLMYTPHDGLYLYTTIDLEFPALVQDALEQGIPAYFFAQTRVVQPRWWWFDEEAAVQNRFWRLSYQPLTRKWRIQSSTISSEQTDQALGLAQSFDSLQAALVRIEHINNWKIADARDLTPGVDYDVEFTLGLDRSRVPRPLLISEGARSFWDMQLKWRQRFSVPE